MTIYPIVIALVLFSSGLLFTTNAISTVVAQNFDSSNITNAFAKLDSKSIYEQKEANIVDKNIKNFVILIPNEGHESTNQDKDQYPLANQPYIPQNLVIGKGTAVTWFNGDVDHDHIIKFESPNNESLSATDTFEYLGHVTVDFNNTGKYSYFEDGDLNDDKSFMMKGTITVVDSTESSTVQGQMNNNTQLNYKTLGILMVPSKDLSAIRSDLSNNGIQPLSDYTFTDLRGGQSGTGPTQSIILWGSESEVIEQIISPIVDITKDLPYS